MKYRSKHPRPDTGMEMSVTLSMPADQDIQASADALCQFMDGINNLVAATGAAWIKIHCSGIPQELESRLEAALAPKHPHLQLVINNAEWP